MFGITDTRYDMCTYFLSLINSIIRDYIASDTESVEED